MARKDASKAAVVNETCGVNLVKIDFIVGAFNFHHPVVAIAKLKLLRRRLDGECFGLLLAACFEIHRHP